VVNFKNFIRADIASGNVYCAFGKTQDLKISLSLILKNLTGLKGQFPLWQERGNKKNAIVYNVYMLLK